MNGLTSAVPSLPTYALLPSLLAYALLIFLLVAKSRSLTSAFVIIAIALRLVMSAVPGFSYSSSPAGLSWNALVSCIVIGCGLLVIRRGRSLALVATPLAPLVMIIVISAVLNSRVGESIEPLVKFGYLGVVAVAIADALREEGLPKVLGRLAGVFVLPFVLQLESIGLGIAKATESDGSVSYIGGYNHEASFSILLVGGLLVAAVNDRLRPSVQIAIISLGVIGVFAANYRTAIVAMSPLIVCVLFAAVLRAVVPRQRAYASIAAGLALLTALPIVNVAIGDRFDTLEVLVQEPTLPLKDPNTFTVAQKEVMSGRVYLWSQYITAWRSGSALQHMVGFGANAWEGKFRYYAHNTLVSTLYELGIFGVVSMLFLWTWMIWLAMGCGPPLRLVLLAAHFGFIVLNMATMPFWMIEGLLLYAILCGTTVFAYSRTSIHAVAGFLPQGRIKTVRSLGEDLQATHEHPRE